jgi:large conductance mechanosensitive channel
MGLGKEFKTFVMRGNVMDMAVGIIIGVAFGKIISSLVNDILLPPIGLLAGGTDFSRLAVTLKTAAGSDPAVTLRYGLFINTIIDFLIVAGVIFMMIKGMNSLKRKQEEVPATPLSPPVQEMLLRDIRDILRNKAEKIL